MKISVIGSGGMWTKYNSACYLIDDSIMVDFLNGACKYLYRFGIEPIMIDYILLTHFHGDHYFDIPFYILNKSKSENKNINIFCSKEGESKIKKLGTLAFPHSFKSACKETNIKFTFTNNFKIKNYEVTKLPVEHGRMKPAFEYVFKDSDNNYIGFTGDTSLCQNVEIMANKCKYLFCDCMLLKGNEKHQGIDNLEYLSSKYPNCTFVVSHLEDITREKLKQLNIKNIFIPEDNETIIV